MSTKVWHYKFTLNEKFSMVERVAGPANGKMKLRALLFSSDRIFVVLLWSAILFYSLKNLSKQPKCILLNNSLYHKKPCFSFFSFLNAFYMAAMIVVGTTSWRTRPTVSSHFHSLAVVAGMVPFQGVEKICCALCPAWHQPICSWSLF